MTAIGSVTCGKGRGRARLALPTRRAGTGQPRRYSRFVGLMKYGLPAVAAALIGAVIAWPTAYDRVNEFRLSYALSAADSGQPGMLNARYVSVDKADRPFVVTADSAVLDPVDADRVKLTALQADMTLNDDSWITLLAEQGEYDRERKILILSDEVDVFSDHGYEFHAKSTRVLLDSGTAISDLPVHGQGPLGTVRADRFRAYDRGQRLSFEGAVHVIVYPNGGEDARAIP